MIAEGREMRKLRASADSYGLSKVYQLVKGSRFEALRSTITCNYDHLLSFSNFSCKINLFLATNLI